MASNNQPAVKKKGLQCDEDFVHFDNVKVLYLYI